MILTHILLIGVLINHKRYVPTYYDIVNDARPWNLPNGPNDYRSHVTSRPALPCPIHHLH